MVRDVAVEEEVSSQLLAETGSALSLQIERFRGPDDFDVDAIGLRTNNRILHRAVGTGGPEVHIIDRPRAARPSDSPAVWMVAMKHFRPAMDEAEFRRIANVGAWDRGRRV